MVDLFARICRERSITGRPVAGRWPDIAGQVKPHDIAVSHHVAYNVGDIEDFLLSLNARARRRVVLEVTAIHPQATLNHLWQHLHGIARPQTPTAEDLVAVLRELGLAPHIEPTRRPAPPTPQPRDLLVSFTRQRLCLGAWEIPIDKKLSMSRPCATLAGDSLRSRGDSRFAGTTQYRWLSRIRPKGTQRPRLQRRP